MTDPILIIGDLIEDWWWRGEIRRKNPEYNAPLVSIFDGYPTKTPGGAGNVQTSLNKRNIPTLTLYGDHHPAKHRLLVGDIMIARWDVDDYSLPVDPQKALELAKNSKLVVVVDYGKGSVYPELADTLSRVDVPILLSTKGNPSRWLSVAEAMFANDEEYNAHKYSYNRHPFVVVTKGPLGADVVSKGDIIASCPSFATYVRSVCGAGDAVLASCAVWWYKNGKPSNPLPMLEAAMRDAAVLVQSEAGGNP